MAKTQRALRECAGWLAECLKIGWRKADLDVLEDLWWRFHDDAGKLFPPGQQRDTNHV